MTSLSILTALLHHPVSTTALSSGLPGAGDTFTPDLCVRAAENAGFAARVVRRADIKEINPLVLPCILLLEGHNACVLAGFTGAERCEVVFPESGTGTQLVTIKNLQAAYTGFAIFVRPQFKFDARAPDLRYTEPYGWFWGTLSRFWPIYSHVVLGSILINLFTLATPLFIMTVYDRVVPNNALETLWVLAIGAIVVFGFDFIMRSLRGYFVDVAGKNADILMESSLLQRVLGARLGQFQGSTGGVANSIRELETLREFFTSSTLTALVDLPFVFLFIGVIWLIGGPLAYVPLAVVPTVLGIGLVLQFPLRRVIERAFRESIHKHATLVEAVESLETIKAQVAEGRVQRDWERFVVGAAESSRKARFFSILATNTAQAATQLAIVGVVVFGVYRLADGQLSLGGLIACVILASRSLAPLGAAAGMLTRLQQARVALRTIDQLMQMEVERPRERTFLHVPRLRGEIEFRSVQFRYPDQQGLALDNVSFRIAPGEKVGIIGRIGSGKSTIARLILGLYEPTAGVVLVDAFDRRQCDPSDIRRNIGHISQEHFLFYGSVRDNIAFGAPNVCETQLLRAADTAGVTQFLKTHPHGLNLQIGERGAKLSGGQRQAIAVARALLMDPPILLMDEPTSNMDTTSETQLVERLEPYFSGKTVVMITHRTSLLRLVDRLIVLDAGKVVADGTKEQVLEALKQGRVRGVV